MFQWWFSLPKVYRIGIIVFTNVLALGFGIAAVGTIVISYYILGFALAAALHSLDQED